MQTLNLFSPPTLPAPGSRQHWHGLNGAAQALALATCARRFEGLTVVITEDTRQAERLGDELRFFSASQGENPAKVLLFPDWETLPYDNFSPHQDIISQRLHTLYHLPQSPTGVLIVPVTTLMHRLAPTSYVLGNSLMVKVGQRFDIQAMRKRFEAAGYHCVDTVYEHGEFAVRGAIMDIFPMGASQPFRIELFDEEVESLRGFDPETQLSQDKVSEIQLLPGKEYPLDDAAIQGFRQRFREEFEVDVRRCPLYTDVSSGLASPGIEYYLPLFFPQLQTLFDYLPENVLLCTVGNPHHGAEQFWHEIRARHENRGVDPQRPILAPETIFLAVEELFSRLKHYSQINLQAEAGKAAAAVWQLPAAPFPVLEVEQKLERPMARLSEFLERLDRTPVLLCTDSPGRRETLLELLRNADLHAQVVEDWPEFLAQAPSLAITVAPLESGLWLESPAMALITENQLFVHHVSQRRRRGKYQDNSDFIIKSLMELHPGAPVVHIDHGVGRYQGLQALEIEGEQTEFLVLLYAEGAKLYVPVSSLHLISRYSGADPDNAPLHRLGNDQWQKARRKAAEKIVDVASELLEVYARRAAQKGYQFRDPGADYQLFANSFPFEETDDQRQAIAAVIADMTAERTMDRLVCGDVGFGKTEVAMRAAFVAVSNHSQVAILVPTTLLAQQHYDNFKDRFADWPVNIALMSRFVSNADQDRFARELSEGRIDIVIGTHKLLQGSIKYKNLGLLIIDEEHRFGVRQKEQLKALRANVDILTLTATPIPRTLNMSMAGMRDLSIIATPPARRLSVKTFVRQSEPALVKEAILRELLRGGQVFFLHNEVKSIERAAEEIRKLVPEARVCVAHGQLRESELERVMSDFYHKRYNVLVCSTIIETGIDIPSANTIIIERADKFGLAQLHQLRGRVGRSHHQAYAYLLAPSPKAMTADAKKRLEAIAAADTLGAGFTLASHDLEIRGAGELLGDEQSGHIQTIGFSLYSEMLAQAVKLLKEGRELDIDRPLHDTTEVNLRLPALIPDYYLPDVHARLQLYKRISNANDDNDLMRLKVEMIDRFGLLPEPVKLLFEVTRLKLDAEALGIAKIEGSAVGGRFEFRANTRVDPLAIVQLVQNQPHIFSLKGAMELKFRHAQEDPASRIAFIDATLKRLVPLRESA